ncbi:isoinhibitor K-like [Tubulanus polymorphus]|uniref:isoinhibitor K-like n=1 Tax=Tubulanus polymorphus TaxID=672921 RepID=UPI003DA40412
MAKLVALLALMFVLVACEARKEECNLPSFTGPCKAFFRKYFFNTATGECELFTYGGCKSNGNNFDTKGLCEKACL